MRRIPVTCQQRLAWLEHALRLASASGALQRARRDRQLACDELWSRTQD